MADKRNESDDSDLYECQMPLLPLPKKQRTTIFRKCIICQTDLQDKLRKGKETSVANFVSKLNVRWDSVYKRLSPDSELLYENEVLWRTSCYAAYTSTQNIKYAAASKTSVVVEDDMEEESPKSSSRVLRSSIHPQDWSKCLFCKSRTYISTGAFIQFAADNNDLNKETLDGKGKTHTTTLVV